MNDGTSHRQSGSLPMGRSDCNMRPLAGRMPTSAVGQGQSLSGRLTMGAKLRVGKDKSQRMPETSAWTNLGRTSRHTAMEPTSPPASRSVASICRCLQGLKRRFLSCYTNSPPTGPNMAASRRPQARQSSPAPAGTARRLSIGVR